MEPIERILERFEWREGLPTLEARSAAAALANELGVRVNQVPLARGFLDNDAAMAALDGEDMVIATHRLLRGSVRRVRLKEATVQRTDAWQRIELEITTRRERLVLRLVVEPACEEFALQLTPDRTAQITFENYLHRSRPKGNL